MTYECAQSNASQTHTYQSQFVYSNTQALASHAIIAEAQWQHVFSKHSDFKGKTFVWRNSFGASAFHLKLSQFTNLFAVSANILIFRILPEATAGPCAVCALSMVKVFPFSVKSIWRQSGAHQELVTCLGTAYCPWWQQGKHHHPFVLFCSKESIRVLSRVTFLDFFKGREKQRFCKRCFFTFTHPNFSHELSYLTFMQIFSCFEGWRGRNIDTSINQLYMEIAFVDQARFLLW